MLPCGGGRMGFPAGANALRPLADVEEEEVAGEVAPGLMEEQAREGLPPARPAVPQVQPRERLYLVRPRGRSGARRVKSRDDTSAQVVFRLYLLSSVGSASLFNPWQ